MRTVRPRRSALYMPGSNARALEKARILPADVLILDFEDAVAPDAKGQARDLVAKALTAGGYGSREIVVRINALDSPWGEEDLEAAVMMNPDAILIPKVSSAEIMSAVGLRLRRLNAPEKIRIWAMIETPMALFQAPGIASTARDVDTRLDCFVMGTNDLAKETGIRLIPGRAPLMPWLMSTLAAARAYELDILDGVYNALNDEAGFRAECIQGRDCGFDGKTLIHPQQIAAANAVFAPEMQDIRDAKAIIDAFADPENQGKGAISVGGRMAERLHTEMAARVLARAEAIQRREADESGLANKP